MEANPGSRGVVIGDRYRIAGALRRTGLIDAVDLEADRAEAACSVVGVPGDAERVDAWEDAWRAAQDEARLPRLREIVADEDGAHWAVLGPSPAAGLPLPPDAHVQARAIGEALAEAGLDADDATRAMLITADDGRLCLDGVVWLGGDRSTRAAGRALADLLPRAPEPVPPAEDWVPPRRSARRAPRRSRVLVPLAIVAVLAIAGVVLLLPARSGGTAVVAPGSTVGGDDAILGSAQYPLVVTERDAATAPSPAGADGPAEALAVVDAEPADALPPPPPVTVTVIVPAPAPATTTATVAPLPEPVEPQLPVASAQRAQELPVADAAATLPLADGG